MSNVTDKYQKFEQACMVCGEELKSWAYAVEHDHKNYQQFVPPRPQKPKKPKANTSQKPKYGIDCVRAEPSNVLDSARCSICTLKYKKTDAVVRVRNFDDASAPAVTTHRRCMEAMLADSANDEAKDEAAFDEYRDRIADKYGIEKD